MKTFEIPANMTVVSETIERIQKEMASKVGRKDLIRACLLAEEVLVQLIKRAPQNAVVRISLGSKAIHMRCVGKALHMSDLHKAIDIASDSTEESEEIITNAIEKLLRQNVRVRSVGGETVVRIAMRAVTQKQIIRMIACLLLGALTGFLMKLLLPSGVNSWIATYFFASINTLTMNALKMIVVPLVFFSISSSIAGYGELRGLGKTAGTVMLSYLITSGIAIAVGYLAYKILPFGNPALRDAVTNAGASIVESSKTTTVSLLDTLVGIVPSNVSAAFRDANMLQIIFLAVLLGIGTSVIPNRNNVLRRLLTDMNTALSAVTGIIVSCLPIAVFFNMAKMVLEIEVSSILSVLSWIPLCWLGFMLMLVVYAIIILLVGRLNPLRFFRGFFTAMLTAFSLASSSATMPTSLRQCDQMGISPKVSSFTIPLGATVNMDGSCITMIATTFFMAKTFGITITSSMLFSIILSIFVLSIGAPGVTGAALVCISMLLPQIGIPAEAISLIMGVYTLNSMGLTMINVTGDAAVTLVVSRLDGKLDLEKYNHN